MHLTGSLCRTTVCSLFLHWLPKITTLDSHSSSYLHSCCVPATKRAAGHLQQSYDVSSVHAAQPLTFHIVLCHLHDSRIDLLVSTSPVSDLISCFVNAVSLSCCLFDRVFCSRLTWIKGPPVTQIQSMRALLPSPTFLHSLSLDENPNAHTQLQTLNPQIMSLIFLPRENPTFRLQRTTLACVVPTTNATVHYQR